MPEMGLAVAEQKGDLIAFGQPFITNITCSAI